MVKVSALIGWLVVLVWAVSGCSLVSPQEVTPTPVVLQTDAISQPTETPSLVLQQETPLPVQPVEPAVATKTTPPTPQPIGIRLPTSTPTPIPTYIYLRGKVLVDQANCRYGPGWPYLYKYGVYKDSVLEIIGRNEAGSWVLIRGVGGTNACWVKASLLEIRGDVMLVEPTDTPLPSSPYYGPLTGVIAERRGDVVIVSWNPLYLRAGDDSEQTSYVVEAWVCQGGDMIFIPLGSDATMVEIRDEWGCRETSRARVTAAEKHGYTAFVEVDWPPAVQP